MIYQFNFPTRIQFGPGAVKLVPDSLKVAGRKRPLVVTDKGLVSLPPVTDTVRLLEEGGLAVAVFAGVWGNPVKSQVEAGGAALPPPQTPPHLRAGGGRRPHATPSA